MRRSGKRRRVVPRVHGRCDGCSRWMRPCRLSGRCWSAWSADRRSIRPSKASWLSRCASSDDRKATYRLKGRGAVVPALALGAALRSIAAGGNIRIVGLLAIGHGDDERRSVSRGGCDERGDQKRGGDSGCDGRVVVVWRLEDRCGRVASWRVFPVGHSAVTV